jgi:hypothetical protein
MAKDVTVKIDRRALAALLKSPEVQADLLARARRIATQAGPGMEASSMVGRTRARASVITATPEAMLAEATTRRLSSSLQAGA